MSDRPTIRLRPKGGRRFFEGGPWVFADEIVMDRRTKALPGGTVAVLENAERTPLAAVAFNPASTIAARFLDADPQARIDADWFAARLTAALALRETLYDAPFYRLVHAEGDGLPGLVIDQFGDALALQPNAAWVEAHLDALLSALGRVIAPATLVMNRAGRVRTLERLEGESETLGAPLEAPVEVAMNGATYFADLTGGQKTGLYFDQRPNHAFAARLSRGRSVLDVFSHVGGFALAALAGGATAALAVDGSAPALALAEEGARRSGVFDRFAMRKSDAFDALRALEAEGRRFGAVICDPPAFAPNKAALTRGLRAYEKTARLAAPLVETGGYLTLCSCSHAATPELFLQSCVQGLRGAGRSAALIRAGGAGPDHPVHAALAETGYLKALSFRLDI